MKTHFGTVRNTPVSLFTLENSKGSKVMLTNYGACIVGILVDDKNGQKADVVLGYDTLEGYLADPNYMGVAVGPCPGRISGAKFLLDGIEYALEQNENGNHLHGGSKGFSFVVWDVVEQSETSLTLIHRHKHLDSGYPGNMEVTITYTLDEDNCLSAKSKVIADRRTIFNITYHPYFNLKGEGNGDITGHQVSINADRVLHLQKDLTPSGRLLAVEGSKFDLRKGKILADAIDRDDALMPGVKSYDGAWVVNKPKGLAKVASVLEPISGRRMDVRSDMPTVVFYAGDYINNLKGKHGHIYNSRAGLCLEPQHFSDAVNHPEFPSIIIEPDKAYLSETQYCFSIEN